jgi:uncharacterized protein YbjT (DUF2867 family)
MVLVVGATGLLGRDVCRRVREGGHELRALVRPGADSERRAELQHLGTQLVEGDLKDPASLREACDGVRAVISTASSTFSRRDGDSIQSVDRDGQIALVDAARAAGVEHFVFVSFRANPEFPHPLADAKMAVARHLAASGMAYTILQASYFMEIWLTPMLGFDYPKGTVRIYGDGSRAVSWVSYRDVARIAVAALDQVAARDTTLNVGGPEALSPLEVVRIFEAAGAAEIEITHVPEADLRAQWEAATDPMQKSFAGLMLQYARGDAMDPTPIQALFRGPLTSVRDHVAMLLAQA